MEAVTGSAVDTIDVVEISAAVVLVGFSVDAEDTIAVVVVIVEVVLEAAAVVADAFVVSVADEAEVVATVVVVVAAVVVVVAAVVDTEVVVVKATAFHFWQALPFTVHCCTLAPLDFSAFATSTAA